MRHSLGRIVLLAGAISASFVSRATATDFYVATNGSDTNFLGSFAAPFQSIGWALGFVGPGDSIFVRGGTYAIDSKVTIADVSGTAENPIKLWAYGDEKPILDFAGQAENSSNRGIQINNSANYWSLKGLTIQNAGDNGLYTEGDHGVFDRIVTRFNRDSGFQLHTTASYNLVLNCDSYENYDPQTANPTKRGENADGFAVKSPLVGPGNIFRGDRAWGNSDDGWDMFEARANGVLIENSWSFDNGYDPHPDAGAFAGDGNGFKLGHDSGSHYLVRVAAWDNPQNGIDVNGNGYKYKIDPETEKEVPDVPNGNLVHVFNSTAFNNGGEDGENGANWRFDENLPHVLRNNASIEGGVLIALGVAQQLNTWNNIPADVNDLASLDDTLARGERRADGSLPLSGFLRLRPGSNLINAGTPISYSFDGTTYTVASVNGVPDVGAFEFGEAVGAVTGDYNGDFVVNAADYTVWRDHLGTSFTMANDTTPGTVRQEDLAVWKSNFGQTLGSGAGSTTSAAIPEPSGILLAFSSLLALLLAGRSLRLPLSFGRATRELAGLIAMVAAVPCKMAGTLALVATSHRVESAR